MNPYIKLLNDTLSAHTPQYGYGSVHSLCEMLYMSYTELNPIDSEKIQTLIHALNPYFRNLSIHEESETFYLLMDLCAEFERLAFLEGMHVGSRLTAELYSKQ